MITAVLICLFITWYLIFNWLDFRIDKELATEVSFVKVLFENKLQKVSSAISLTFVSIFCITWLLSATEDKSVLQVTMKDVYYIFFEEDKIMMKITTKCSTCDIRIKFFDTSGNLRKMRFKRDKVHYDGGNKVIEYEIKRPEGFRKRFMGNPINQHTLHLDKEYALWIF